MTGRITRRTAVKSMVTAPFLLTILPSDLARGYSANEKLNIALVGCGTRGRGLMEALGRMGENLVAMCDVNEQRAARAYRMAPDVPKHVDYRRMLDEQEGQIDAVMVATSDHHHAPCTAKAMKMGKPSSSEANSAAAGVWSSANGARSFRPGTTPAIGSCRTKPCTRFNGPNPSCRVREAMNGNGLTRSAAKWKSRRRTSTTPGD